MYESWGSGSCYINAAIQFVFSSSGVQKKLANLLAASAHRVAPSFERRWSFCTSANVHNIQAANIQAAKDQRNRSIDDWTWALTLAASLQGRSATGEPLRGLALYPALFLEKAYEGRQDDATYFLFESLRASSQIKELFTGRYHPALLQCHSCGGQSKAGGHDDERTFTTVQVQGHHADVRSAILASFREELDDHFKKFCCNQSCRKRWSHKYQDIEKLPQVLFIQINRWDYSQVVPRRLPSNMTLESTFNLLDVAFALKGIIYHQGDSPAAGHYVAAAHHGGHIFVYNDAHWQEIPAKALASDTWLPGSIATVTMFHATALLYEQMP